jgi:hypothetical protein
LERSLDPQKVDQFPNQCVIIKPHGSDSIHATITRDQPFTNAVSLENVGPRHGSVIKSTDTISNNEIFEMTLCPQSRGSL